ncbi:MAG: outer membrane protein assembly factor BamB family protein [Thermoplasmatota archaeon]
MLGRQAFRWAAVATLLLAAPLPAPAQIATATYSLSLLATHLPGVATDGAGVATDGHDIYLFGGATGVGVGDGPATDKILRFDPTTWRVSVLPVTLPARREWSSVIWNGHSFDIFGGTSDATFDHVLADIVEFDPEAGTVRTLGASLPSARAGTAAIWDGHNAYVVGGDDQTGTQLSQIVRFDPITGTASALPNGLPEPYVVWSMSAGVWTGKYAFFFGNLHGGSHVIRFDPAIGRAIRMTDLVATVPDTSAFFDGGYVYLNGIDRGTSTARLPDMLRYNPQEGTSAILDQHMPTYRDEIATAFVAPNAYLFGGGDTSHSDEIFCYGPHCALASATVTPPKVHGDCAWPGNATAPHWPMAGGSASDSGAADNQVPARLEPWTLDLGAPATAASAPALAGCRLFVGAGPWLWAVNPATGRPLWRIGLGSPLAGRPAVDGSHVYVVTAAETLYALDAPSGIDLWQAATGPDPSGPVVANTTGGPVVVGSRDGNVYAYDPATGNLRWHTNTGGAVGAPALDLDSVRYGNTFEGRLGRLDVGNGVTLGDYATYTAISSPVAFAGDLTYAAAGHTVVAVDLAQGDLRWRNGSMTTQTGVAVEGGRLFSGALDGALSAFNATTGALLWRFGGPSPFWAPPAAAGLVFAGDGNGTLYALNETDGRLTWKSHLGGALPASPAAAGPLVYVVSSDGVLHAVPTGAGLPAVAVTPLAAVANVTTTPALPSASSSQQAQPLASPASHPVQAGPQAHMTRVEWPLPAVAAAAAALLILLVWRRRREPEE